MKIIPFTILVLALNANAQPSASPHAPSESPEKLNTAPTSIPDNKNTGDVSTKLEEAYPTGPYKDGTYEESIGEERQAEEERIKKVEDKTRVNRFGPNKL